MEKMIEGVDGVCGRTRFVKGLVVVKKTTRCEERQWKNTKAKHPVTASILKLCSYTEA
jgi:hypothetical protein